MVKGPREEDIAAARAAYQAAVAAVALAQRQFDDSRLYAQSDGVVENRILEPGDMASPSTPVFTIALPSPLWVRAYVPESHLGRVRIGIAATVSTDSYPGHVYHGWIGYLSPTAEFTPKGEFGRAYDELRNFLHARSRTNQRVSAEYRRLHFLRRTGTVLSVCGPPEIIPTLVSPAVPTGTSAGRANFYT